MVDLNAGPGPEMTEIDGVQYRPEHVDAARAASEARKSFPVGAVDPSPIGVPPATDNRRLTFREQAIEAGVEGVDPASTVLARESAPDVGPVPDDADPVTTATASGTVTKPTRKRASSASDAGE